MTTTQLLLFLTAMAALVAGSVIWSARRPVTAGEAAGTAAVAVAVYVGMLSMFGLSIALALAS